MPAVSRPVCAQAIAPPKGFTMTASVPPTAALRTGFSWQRWCSLLAVIAMTVAALALQGRRADAARITGAITNVTLTPTNPSTGSQVNTTMDYCVPNGTVAGDTFTLTLASQLTN